MNAIKFEQPDPIFDWSLSVQRAYVAGSLGFNRIAKGGGKADPVLLDTLLEVRRSHGRDAYYQKVLAVRKMVRDSGFGLVPQSAVNPGDFSHSAELDFLATWYSSQHEEEAARQDSGAR